MKWLPGVSLLGAIRPGVSSGVALALVSAKARAVAGKTQAFYEAGSDAAIFNTLSPTGRERARVRVYI